jgi:predicted type IV restriction endonuclease
MGVPTSAAGYTSAITGRGDYEVRKGLVVAMEKKNNVTTLGRRSISVLVVSKFTNVQWLIVTVEPVNPGGNYIYRQV